VGWNEALATRLSMDVEHSFCVKGYKGDAERRIGIVGHVTVFRDVLLNRIKEEIGDFELAHNGVSDEIRAVAIMNAFSEEEVYRVVQMALERGWAEPGDDARGRHILYLTGQPRVSGVEAEKALGMTVACVGHRPAEDWGIRYLATQLRSTFPGLRVEELYEEEVPRGYEKKES
jgi:putative NIF3 family GTP cyclohydrolase 1 type 2